MREWDGQIAEKLCMSGVAAFLSIPTHFSRIIRLPCVFHAGVRGFYFSAPLLTTAIAATAGFHLSFKLAPVPASSNISAAMSEGVAFQNIRAYCNCLPSIILQFRLIVG